MISKEVVGDERELVANSKREWQWHPAYELEGDGVIPSFSTYDAAFISHFSPERIEQMLDEIDLLREYVSEVKEAAKRAEKSQRVRASQQIGWNGRYGQI